MLPYLVWCQNSYAIAKPRVVINQITDYSVSFVVRTDQGKPTAKLISNKTKLVFEAACEGSRFQTLGARLNPRKIELFYDSPPSDINCKYRARVIYRSAKRILKKLISNTVSVTIEDPDLIDDFARPTPAPTPEQDYSGPSLPQQFSECSNGVEAEMMARANFHRAQHGLDPLVFNALLRKAARMHSIRMGLAGILTHDGWFEEIMGLGFHGTLAAQNIADSINDPVVVVDLWMTSEMHRYNILNDRASLIGVACVRDQNGFEWWTMNLGG